MKLKLLLLALLISFLSCEKNDIDSLDDNELTDYEQLLVDELNQIITPLYGPDLTLDNSDIEVFSEFGNATIIGLGEATHGTKEFFEMKHRLFKYFVEQHGFKIFGFEADMGESIYIDRFITKGIGTIDEVIQKMHFWTWKTEEVKELILWMKEYNSGKNEEDWIHFLGVDCQSITYNQDLIEEYLNSFNNSYPSYINSLLEEFSIINETRELPDNDGLPQNTILTKLNLKCDSIKAYFEDNKMIFISESSEYEYNLIVRLIEQTKQCFKVISSSSSLMYRDYYMAENSKWLTTLFNSSTKTVLWAHNAHVAKDPQYGDGNSQGYHLAKELNDNYKVIGFSFNIGSFRAVGFNNETIQYTDIKPHTISRLPKKGTYQHIFYYAEPKDFILLNSNISSSGSLSDWCNRDREYVSIGSVYNNSWNHWVRRDIKSEFDAIIHIHETNAAVGYTSN